MWLNRSSILSVFKLHPKPVLLASCDEDYFRKYAGSLIASAREHDECLHIHVVNPSQKTMTDLDAWASERISNSLSYSCEFIDLTGVPDTRRKVYYASARFAAAEHYLDWFFEYSGDDHYIVFIDLDSVINQSIDWDSLLVNKPMLGIFDRREDDLGNNDVEKRGMKVLANGFCREACVFKDIYEFIEARNFDYWFLDQEAIYEVWTKYYYHSAWVDIRKTKLIDYDFQPDTYIWSGKGPRKWSNPTYMDAAEKWMEIYQAELKRLTSQMFSTRMR